MRLVGLRSWWRLAVFTGDGTRMKKGMEFNRSFHGLRPPPSIKMECAGCFYGSWTERTERGNLCTKREFQQSGGGCANWRLGFWRASGEVKLLRPGTVALRCKGACARVLADGHHAHGCFWARKGRGCPGLSRFGLHCPMGHSFLGNGSWVPSGRMFAHGCRIYRMGTARRRSEAMVPRAGLCRGNGMSASPPSLAASYGVALCRSKRSFSKAEAAVRIGGLVFAGVGRGCVLRAGCPRSAAKVLAHGHHAHGHRIMGMLALHSRRPSLGSYGVALCRRKGVSAKRRYARRMAGTCLIWEQVHCAFLRCIVCNTGARPKEVPRAESFHMIVD
ncbi:MAG: hypothetical protein JWR26_28 [Pedosphaera sp.]|nr:hypothetical protein [Pedosphaera sp.]